MNQDEANLEYLKLAQDLETFGITYFNVVNTKGTDGLLGVDALGINYYDMKDKFNPKSSFPWSEIRKLSYTKDKLKVYILYYVLCSLCRSRPSGRRTSSKSLPISDPIH